SVCRDEGVYGDEERQRERLGARLQKPWPDNDRYQCCGCNAPRRRTQSTCRNHRSDERERVERERRCNGQLHPAGTNELVEAELSQPLLVDPAHTSGPDGEVIDVRKSMLGDQAPVDEREPGVWRD